MIKEKNLRIILDTNVLLVSISSKSKYHWIFKNLIEGKYELFITNEILNEYEEIISNKFNNEVANNLIKTLLILPNVYKTEIYFKWNLIKEDMDDNKFVDCFVSSDSNYLVTHDKHFDILKEIDFPKILTIKINEFYDILYKK